MDTMLDLTVLITTWTNWCTCQSSNNLSLSISNCNWFYSTTLCIDLYKAYSPNITTICNKGKNVSFKLVKVNTNPTQWSQHSSPIRYSPNSTQILNSDLVLPVLECLELVNYKTKTAKDIFRSMTLIECYIPKSCFHSICLTLYQEEII